MINIFSSQKLATYFSDTNNLDDNESNYISSISKKAIINNISSQYKSEITLGTTIEDVVSETMGQNEPSSIGTWTDSNFKGELDIEKRCELLFKFHNFLSQKIPNFLGKDRYEKNLDTQNNICQIKKITSYDDYY